MRDDDKIYMLGIGGIGMSALAQLLHGRGICVAGTDREDSPTTQMLRGSGIDVEIDAKQLPNDISKIIYSDAVWPDNPLRQEADKLCIESRSYFESLGQISREYNKVIAVAGTHGKTTTTGMIAKILHDAGLNPTAIVGSIVRDFAGNGGAGSNFLQGDMDIFVVEACEYRDHLLQLHPDILVITNIELDHTDFFPSLSALQSTFRKAVHNVRENGIVIADVCNKSVANVLGNCDATIIDYLQLSVPKLQLIGEFNQDNARAAKAAALAAYPSISAISCDESLSGFIGSWRRFEHKGSTSLGAIVYDDYAHHPTAIDKTIVAVRSKFPDKKVVVAFHPHLYSRTKYFFDEFASALSHADEVFVAPIYAAREKLDANITHTALATAVRRLGTPAHAPLSFDGIRDALEKFDENTIIITMGAGDIYKVSEQIVESKIKY